MHERNIQVYSMQYLCPLKDSSTSHWHADKVNYESGDEDATSSKEHLAGLDPFLGPVLDPFVAVSLPRKMHSSRTVPCCESQILAAWSQNCT